MMLVEKSCGHVTQSSIRLRFQFVSALLGSGGVLFFLGLVVLVVPGAVVWCR